jgi:hypothetical protein
MPSRSRPTVDRDELLVLRARTGITISEIADLTHASSRTVESWLASAGSKVQRGMPYSAYELLLAKLGIVRLPLYVTRAEKKKGKRKPLP